MFRVIASCTIALTLVLGVSTPSEALSNKEVITIAKSLEGSPYKSGGTSPSGFDCSGFTYYVHKQAGKTIPRTSHGQYRASKHVTRDNAKKGDLVFFANKSGYVHHVGIYMGNNKILHSPKPGRSVRLETIWSKNVRFGQF